jgi:hypothetical protein
MGEDIEWHRKRKWEEIVATHLFAELETGLALLPARVVDMISSRLAADISRITSTKKKSGRQQIKCTQRGEEINVSSLSRFPIRSNNQPGVLGVVARTASLCVICERPRTLSAPSCCAGGLPSRVSMFAGLFSETAEWNRDNKPSLPGFNPPSARPFAAKKLAEIFGILLRILQFQFSPHSIGVVPRKYPDTIITEIYKASTNGRLVAQQALPGDQPRARRVMKHATKFKHTSWSELPSAPFALRATPVHTTKTSATYG